MRCTWLLYILHVNNVEIEVGPDSRQVLVFLIMDVHCHKKYTSSKKIDYIYIITEVPVEVTHASVHNWLGIYLFFLKIAVKQKSLKKGAFLSNPPSRMSMLCNN